jgi:hypothetical protein
MNITYQLACLYDDKNLKVNKRNIWDKKYYSMQLSLSTCKLATRKWDFCFLGDVNCEDQRELKIG